MASTQAGQQCARCCHVPATIICESCREGREANGVITNTRYCSTDCQEAHLLVHHRLCQQKRRIKCLYRAGELLQAAFYSYREHVFDLPLTDMREGSDGRLHIAMNAWSDGEDHLVYDLPNRHFRTRQDRYAVLVYDGDDEAVARMAELTRKLFDGLADSIVEVKVHLDRSHWRVVRHFLDCGTIDLGGESHSMVVVQMREGEAYAVDLTGAQYGQPLPVMPLAVFQETYTAEIIAESPHGSCAATLLNALEGRRDADFDSDYDMRVDQIRHQVMGQFNDLVARWEVTHGKPVRRILDEPRARYEVDKAALLAELQAGMNRYMVYWKIDGCRLEALGSRFCYTDRTTQVGKEEGRWNVGCGLADEDWGWCVCCFEDETQEATKGLWPVTIPA